METFAVKNKKRIAARGKVPKGSGPRKVTKKIKYYKTPLNPYFDELVGLWKVKFKSNNGVVPKSLEGAFTKKDLAQDQIDIFLSKHQVEYIDDNGTS